MSANPENANTNEKSPRPLSAETRSILDQLKPFRGIPINVSVELGRGTLKLRDLLELRYHSVFALDQAAGAKLNVYANGILLGKGEPVILEDQVGIKIHEILDSQQ